VNPNFAAVVVEMLRQARVREGDAVAIGFSGSFPAINICVLAAVDTLRLRPLIITSVGASQWGANHPELTWLDMEQLLSESGLLPYRSLAASPGGIDDRAMGLSKRGRRAITTAVERTGLPLIEPEDYADSLAKRMALYREQPEEADVRAYINVGGGSTSVGTRVGKQLFKPGLNRSAPPGKMVDSVMARFAERGVPVIHVIKIDELAERYGLPLQPQAMPPVGEGTIYVRQSYSSWLTAAVLAVIVALLAALLRFDLGHRVLMAGRRERDTGQSAAPEPMV